MSSVSVFYYDGRSSARHQVVLERNGEHLTIRGKGVDVTVPLNSVQVAPEVGELKRSFRLPNGALCEFQDTASYAMIFDPKSERRIHRFIHGWERSIPLALLALVLTLSVIVGFVRNVVPSLARHVAQAIPPESEATLGKESLAFLDRYLMKPTLLPEDRQNEVRTLFSEIKGRLPGAEGYRIELRSAKSIGANAFALPGGTIVVTDAMVELAQGTHELAGVLAHEAAHQRSRHALRQVLQSAGTGLLIAGLTGDITSITSLSATLPTALIDAGYSREFEYEADDAAVAYLKKAGINPKVYADTLGRLQGEHDKKAGEKRRGRWSPMELLSTHPETSERIKRVLTST